MKVVGETHASRSSSSTHQETEKYFLLIFFIVKIHTLGPMLLLIVFYSTSPPHFSMISQPWTVRPYACSSAPDPNPWENAHSFQYGMGIGRSKGPFSGHWPTLGSGGRPEIPPDRHFEAGHKGNRTPACPGSERRTPPPPGREGAKRWEPQVGHTSVTPVPLHSVLWALWGPPSYSEQGSKPHFLSPPTWFSSRKVMWPLHLHYNGL